MMTGKLKDNDILGIIGSGGGYNYA